MTDGKNCYGGIKKSYMRIRLESDGKNCYGGIKKSYMRIRPDSDGGYNF